MITCTRHIEVEKSVAIKSMALALTADNPFDGDVALAISGLVESCRECNTSLSVVMSTIWYRIGETKSSLWRHQLLALYLLKTLLLHGVSIFCLLFCAIAIAVQIISPMTLSILFS